MLVKNRLLVFLAYLLGIPALYIVLAASRKSKFVSYHGSQAMLLWCGYFVLFFGLRFLVNHIWQSRYLPGLEWLEISLVLLLAFYAFFCGLRAFMGRAFQIPL